MRAASLVAVVLLALGSSRSEASRTSARVRYVTAKRAYLDAGALDGLARGELVKLTRNGRAAASCTITEVADHTAVCTTSDARVGDELPLHAAPAPPLAKVATLPPPPSPREIADAQARLADASIPMVEFHDTSPRLSQGAPVLRLSIGHTAMVSFGGGNDFQQERIDVTLSGLDLHFLGLRASVRATALLYTDAPAATRFRPGDNLQIYVWQTEVSSREEGRRYVLSVGRIWPYHAPGLTVVDGVQAGWRSKEGDVEVGGVAGTVPDAMTLAPSLSRWTTGVYYGATHARPRRTVRLLRHEARLGVRGADGVSPQLELEGLVQAWLAQIADTALQTRATLSTSDWSSPHLEALRWSLNLHPKTWLRMLTSFRYLGPRPADFDAFATGLLSTGTWYYGDLSAMVDVGPRLGVSAIAGAAYDGSSQNDREWIGLDLNFPTLLSAGVLSLGYREELGSLSGRSAHVQLATVRERYRLLVRLSYFGDVQSGTTGSATAHTIGLFATADARLLAWLNFRLSAMARFDVSDIAGGSLPTSLQLRADLAGAL